jgi:hypothetical protein
MTMTTGMFISSPLLAAKKGQSSWWNFAARFHLGRNDNFFFLDTYNDLRAVIRLGPMRQVLNGMVLMKVGPIGTGQQMDIRCKEL